MSQCCPASSTLVCLPMTPPGLCTNNDNSSFFLLLLAHSSFPPPRPSPTYSILTHTCSHSATWSGLLVTTRVPLIGLAPARRESNVARLSYASLRSRDNLRCSRCSLYAAQVLILAQAEIMPGCARALARRHCLPCRALRQRKKILCSRSSRRSTGERGKPARCTPTSGG